ncbi:MAG: Crp/Fnr family transcriptional regulator [Pseudomonadota bacterium]
MPRRSPPEVTLCGTCPLRDRETFREFTDEEIQFIQRFKTGELVVQPGGTVVLDGHDSPHIFTVLSGWAIRFKELENGDRQIVNFAFPGDLVGMQASMFERMEHTVEALSHVTLCVFERARIWDVFRNYPGLSFDMTWLAAKEELFVAHHLVAIANRSARERIAYLLAFLARRATTTGLVEDWCDLKIPMTQQQIADTMALSLVHTNKTLKELERNGVIHWQRRQLTIKDRGQLEEIAGELPPDVLPRPFV